MDLSTYNVLLYNEYFKRMILSDGKMCIKIEKRYPLIGRINEIQGLVRGNDRFVVWDDIPEIDSSIYRKLSLDPDSQWSQSKHQGIDCERLLRSTWTCESCRSSLKGEFEYSISKNHYQTFLGYLFDSVNVLSNLNIHHNDLRLANILVNPTLEEQETKIITTSLPKIIDFGLSVITPDAKEKNGKDLWDLFKTCKHGMSWIQSDNWLTQCVDNPDRYCGDILINPNKFELQRWTLTSVSYDDSEHDMPKFKKAGQAWKQRGGTR